MDVRLPDGTILRNVPEGTTKAQIAAKLGMAEMPQQDVTAQVMKAEEPKMGAGSAALTGALQGATFGLADEIIARLGSLSPDLTYQEIKQAADEDLARARKDRPGMTLAGELGGGLATGLAGGLTKAGQSVASSLVRGSLPARIAKGAGVGAISGGLYGAGTAEEGKRLEGAKSGALVGGTIGGAIPAVGAAVKSVASGVSNLKGGIKARDVEALDNAAAAIKQRASGSYQKMREAGAVFKPETTNSIISSVRKKITDDGLLNERIHTKTLGVLSDLEEAAKSPDFGLEALDQWRQVLGDVAGDVLNKADARKATLAINAIDDAIEGLPDSAITAGTRPAIDALKNARREWARTRRFEAITDIVRKSEGDANMIKRELKKFLDNPKKIRGFNAQELKDLQSAAKNSTTEGILKSLGKFGFDLGGSRAAGNTGLPVIGGVLTGASVDPLTGIAVPVVGTAARQSQKWLARGKVEKLLQTIENGGQVTTKQLADLPPEDAKKLMDVMLGVTLPRQGVTLPEKVK